MSDDIKPLTLTIGRWLGPSGEEDAELTFDFYPNLQMADMDLRWGPGSRQSRSYAIQWDDLDALHEWLSQLPSAVIQARMKTDGEAPRSHRAPGR